MAKRIANSALNASTVNILNVIRQNASAAYQAEVPVITKATDIPKVGEVIYGTPAFSNEFLNALVNRIAIVRVKSANFYNPYSPLKKGYLEYGESIEDIFVNIANVVDYSAEKAEAREFKRTIPDVRSLFHVMNWRVMYPVTIQDNDLRMAFLSEDGVTGLIEKIVESVYTAAEYDEFLLFKYLLIKTISSGKVYHKYFKAYDNPTMAGYAAAFRGVSNKLLFMGKNYNEAGVKTNTPRDRQVIFMDADFNAKFDVDVLSAAFNMEKADFMGRLFLIDSFSEFDNERFETIRANSDGLEKIEDEELEAMKGVKAVILDEDFFQVYDNNNKFTEKYVASGLYWNYFYHTWKTVSYSPFANAICFLEGDPGADATAINVKVTGKDTRNEGIALTLAGEPDKFNGGIDTVKFIQTEALTKAGISITPDGAMLIPSSQAKSAITVNATYNGKAFTTASKTFTGDAVKVGDTVVLTATT